MLGVGDGVADDILEEDLEDAPGLLVDETRDPLNAAPSGQAPDGGLRDALGMNDVKERPMELISCKSKRFKARVTWMLSRRTFRCLLAPPLPSPFPPFPRPDILVVLASLKESRFTIQIHVDKSAKIARIHTRSYTINICPALPQTSRTSAVLVAVRATIQDIQASLDVLHSMYRDWNLSNPARTPAPTIH